MNSKKIMSLKLDKTYFICKIPELKRISWIVSLCGLAFKIRRNTIACNGVIAFDYTH